MLRVNFSTSLSTQTTRLPILPRLTGSRRLLVPSTACPFSLPCPHLPTLSVTCPAQPSGPPAPPKLSHCTLAQSTSFPHLPRTLWFPEWSPLWTTGHTYHGNPTPQHTDTHHSKCPIPQPVLTWLFPVQDLDLRPWSESMEIHIPWHSALPPLLPSQKSFPADLHEVILLIVPFQSPWHLPLLPP